MSPLFGPRPIAFGAPHPGQMLLPDFAAMRTYAEETSHLAERSQERMMRDQEQLGRLSSAVVTDLLPLLEKARLVEGEVGDERFSDLAIAVATGISISQEEQALGWQSAKGADPRAFNAVVAAGLRSGGSAVEAYLVRVGYFVGRHGAPGLAEVTRVLGG